MTETETKAPAACAKCKKDITEASACDRCDVQYCSTSCMNLDWKKHKKGCTRSKLSKPSPPPPTTKPAVAATSSSTPYVAGEKLPKGLKKPVDGTMGWKRLGKGTWFHKRPESDVYKLLIDVYRLRMDDRWNVAKKAEPGSLYVRGATSGAAGFSTFLDKAAKVRSDKGYRLLPDWWSKEKRAECEALGADTTQWTSLSRKVTELDIHEHYEHYGLAMQLRSVAQGVYNLLADGRKIMKIPKAFFERDPELDYYGAYDDRLPLREHPAETNTSPSDRSFSTYNLYLIRILRSLSMAWKSRKFFSIQGSIWYMKLDPTIIEPQSPTIHKMIPLSSVHGPSDARRSKQVKVERSLFRRHRRSRRVAH